MLRNLQLSHKQRQVTGVYVSVVIYLLLAPKKFLPGCPFHSYFGIYCPACGATRAMRAALSGDLITAIHDNVLLFTVPLFIAVGLYLQKRYSNKTLLVTYVIGLILITLGFTVIRNLNNSPLAPLA